MSSIHLIGTCFCVKKATYIIRTFFFSGTLCNEHAQDRMKEWYRRYS